MEEAELEATAQLQLAQLYGQCGYTGLQGVGLQQGLAIQPLQGMAFQPLQPQYLQQGFQGLGAGGQGLGKQQQQGE